jgi:photosystem I subunit 2
MAEELSGQTPIFGGSTGGLLTKADVEEKYVITWTSPKEQHFEMPTGGTAIMRQGQNKLELARKEYAIALGGQQLRTKFKLQTTKSIGFIQMGKLSTYIRKMAYSQRKSTQVVKWCVM